jgi:8-oxo-(d)GTP phosphatase
VLVAIIRTAGGILWRPGRRGPRVAVIHRPRQDDWTLPKGKLEAGEAWHAAALREVQEETGCTARLGAFAGASCYEVKRGLKMVLYWHMEVSCQGQLERLHEVDEVRWLTPDDALEILDHARERLILQRARERRGSGVDALYLVHGGEVAIARGELERARRLIEATQRAA